MKWIRKNYVDIIIGQFLKYLKYFFFAFLISLIVTGIAYLAPLLNVKIIDDGIGKKNIRVLITAVLLYLAVCILREIFRIVQTLANRRLTYQIEVDLKYNIMEYLIENRGKKREGMTGGEIDSLVKNDTRTFISFLTGDVQELIINCIKVIISVLLLIKMQWDLGLFVILFQITTFSLQLKLNKKLERNGMRLREAFITLMNSLNEIIHNIKNIALIHGKDFLLGRYRDNLKDCYKKEQKGQILFSGILSGLEVADTVLTCTILLIGGYKIIYGKMTIGTLVTFMQYAGIFTEPLKALISIPTEYSNNKASILSISRILKQIQKEEKQKLNMTDVSNIKIDGLYFHYEGQEEIFCNARADFRKGGIYYIIGPSGIGKSTLVKLLTGECRGTDSIWFDSFLAADLNLNDFVNLITWIPQEPVIFRDTVFNNLCLGNPEAEDNMEEVCSACAILEDIRRLPNGFDTLIDENGDSLSVGQKHRLAIARALLQDKPVLIMDEGTAGLDRQTELTVRERLRTYFCNKIVIIITHSMEFILQDSIVYEIKNKEMIKKRGEDYVQNNN